MRIFDKTANELFNVERFAIKFRQHKTAPPNAFDVIKL